MTRQQDVDELFEVRNYYYIGNYQQCINEAQKLRKPSSAEVERDIFMYRSYMAQNKFLVVLDEIKPSSPDKLQPLKLLADYLANNRKASVTNSNELNIVQFHRFRHVYKPHAICGL